LKQVRSRKKKFLNDDLWKFFIGSLSSNEPSITIESDSPASFTLVSESNETTWFDWLSLILLIYIAFPTATTFSTESSSFETTPSYLPFSSSKLFIFIFLLNNLSFLAEITLAPTPTRSNKVS
jgi:hypothetical protein